MRKTADAAGKLAVLATGDDPKAASAAVWALGEIAPWISLTFAPSVSIQRASLGPSVPPVAAMPAASRLTAS